MTEPKTEKTFEEITFTGEVDFVNIAAMARNIADSSASMETKQNIFHTTIIPKAIDTGIVFEVAQISSTSGPDYQRPEQINVNKTADNLVEKSDEVILILESVGIKV